MESDNIEQTIKELKANIDGLKELATTAKIDLSEEIALMENKLVNLNKQLHQNLNTWQKVQIARHQARPTTLDYIEKVFDDFIELHGDRLYGDDPAIVGGIGSFDGVPVTVIGHQKGRNTKENIHRRFGMPQPEGYRKALRLMQQANKFGRPIITFINTAGAYPGKEAEERGQSEAIARNLREMASLEVPIICIVIGEGGSGGALALGISNKIHMLENTFYSVISPEGAAALLWKDSTKAQKAAETLKITAKDLKDFGIIDNIIPEPVGGAHTNLIEQAKTIKEYLRTSMHELSFYSKQELIIDRFEKFRKIGEFKEKVK